MMQRFFLGVALLIACTASAFEEAATGEKLLFLIHAKQADIERHEGNPAYATMKLTDVSHSVTFYSDPPNRHGGTMPLEDFLEQWSKGKMSFQKVPPNAGFVFYEGRNMDYHDISLELRKPHYRPSRGELTFQIYLLNKFDEKTVHDVTLFIDDSGTIHPGGTT